MDSQLRSINARIGNLKAGLGKLGLKLPDAPDTSDLPTVQAVTDGDIAAAVGKAKGDPAADKEVQRLITARALGGIRYDVSHRAAQVEAHDKIIREAIPALLEQVHERFADAAEVLEENGQQFKSHRDLGSVNLASLPGHSAAAAGVSLSACRTMDDAVTAMKALGGYGREGGTKTEWWHYSTPSQAQYEQAMNDAPSTFPEGNAWSVFARGWPLEMAETLHAAGERRAGYRAALNERIEQGKLEGARAGMVSGGAKVAFL